MQSILQRQVPITSIADELLNNMEGVRFGRLEAFRIVENEEFISLGGDF
jgi:hypothetical protein